jgi:hypothetical protein
VARRDTSLRAAVANFDALPDGAYVRMAVGCLVLDKDRSTLWRWVHDGRLTVYDLGPRQPGERSTVGLRVGDIRAIARAR